MHIRLYKIKRNIQAMTLGLVVFGVIGWKNSPMVNTAFIILGLCMCLYVCYVLKNNSDQEQTDRFLLYGAMIHLIIIFCLIGVHILIGRNYSFCLYITAMFSIMQSGVLLVKIKNNKVIYVIGWAVLICCILETIFM